jgi:hypothetical protein
MTHWTENDFTEWLYGLKSGSHLDECAACSRTARSLELRKAQATQGPEVSSDFLAEQRRTIYARLDRPRHWTQSRWILSFAMLVMVVLAGFGLLHERPSTTTPLASPADEKLFSDLASIDQSNEPRAIKPIESLFEQ